MTERRSWEWFLRVVFTNYLFNLKITSWNIFRAPPFIDREYKNKTLFKINTIFDTFLITFVFFCLMKSKQNMKNNNAKSMKNLLTNKLLRIFSLRMLHRIHWKWPILQRHRWMCNWWVFSSFYYFDYDWATIYPKFLIHKKLFAYNSYTVRNSSFSENNDIPIDIFNVKRPQLSKNKKKLVP